jgi:hypothetical protein
MSETVSAIQLSVNMSENLYSGLCHVMPVTGLKRPNTGKDDDDYDDV